MRIVANITLTDDGLRDRQFDRQTIDIKDAWKIERMSSDGIPSVGYVPARVLWEGAKIEDLEDISHMRIVGHNLDLIAVVKSSQKVPDGILFSMVVETEVSAG